MKKLLLTTIMVLCTCFAVACNVATPLDAVTLKLNDTKSLADCSIKFLSNNAMSASYYITPSGFELDKLAGKGYNMRITVTYDVYYKKDWSLGVGYAGSPKYEISILNTDGMGKANYDLTTSATAKTRTFSYASTVVDIKDTRLVLTFSTDNIQNIIYFKNIKVSYQCYL